MDGKVRSEEPSRTLHLPTHYHLRDRASGAAYCTAHIHIHIHVKLVVRSRLACDVCEQRLCHTSALQSAQLLLFMVVNIAGQLPKARVMYTVARGREGEGPRWGFTVFPHPGDSPAVVKPHPRALAAAVIRA